MCVITVLATTTAVLMLVAQYIQQRVQTARDSICFVYDFDILRRACSSEGQRSHSTLAQASGMRFTEHSLVVQRAVLPCTTA